MPNSTQQIPNQPVKFIIFCSREHKRWAITALLAVISAVAVERIMIYLLKELTDAAIAVNFSDSVSVSTLWHFVWAYPTAYFLCTTSYRISGFTGMRWHTLAGATAYNELFRYLSAHSLGFFHDRFAGALSNKVSNAVKGMQALLGKSLWQLG